MPGFEFNMFNSKRSSTLTQTARLSTYGAAPMAVPARPAATIIRRRFPSSSSRATSTANGTSVTMGIIFVPNEPIGMSAAHAEYSRTRERASPSANNTIATTAHRITATVHVSGIP